MTRKNLSNGWVATLKNSYLFQTFSFEIFILSRPLSKNLARIPTTEALKNGKKTSKPKQIQSIGIQIIIFKA